MTDPEKIARVRHYFDRLTASDMAGIIDMFEADGIVISPFLGEIAAKAFFAKLGETSAQSTLTVFDVLLGQGSAAAHFRYDWVLKSGDAITFEGVDYFRFGKNDKFASLSIFYDTHPVRADVGDKYA